MAKRQVMIVAGEASGDGHAAKLVTALRDLLGEDVRFFGAAGPKMREVGVEPIVASDDLSIIGILEIGRALPKFWRAFKTLRDEAAKRRPDVAILVDFPDFNLKLARALKKRGIKVVYYISPQLWAWRKYRIRTIRRYVDLVISILPFEKAWYAEHGVEHVEYVGSPLAREIHASSSKEEFCERHNLDPGRPIVALLPGSRHAEITRILPLLLETAEAMLRKEGGIQFVVALPAGRLSRIEPKMLQRVRGLTWLEGETLDALNAADAAAITSGTATLEAGIIGTPMAIVYKASRLNYGLLRPLIEVEHFGLINLIAEERIARELIQDEFTPETLADELFRLLDPEINANTRNQLKTAVEKLGHGGASMRAAEAIQRLLT